VVARWYSPSLGRFISVDSVAGSPADPQSLDRYSYVMGNPLGGVDPFGTCNWDTVSTTCKADVAPTRAGPDGRALAAAAAAKVAAMPRPVNPCLASNFHAAGCSGGAVWKADTKNSATCAKTGAHTPNTPTT
jgi:hypothetical protein